ILLVPMMLFLPKIFGLNGIWFAQPIADVISCVVTAIVVIREVKSHKVSADGDVDKKVVSA
ncbi:MAG: MATE family efflux transporter, partial [Clostridium sp.]